MHALPGGKMMRSASPISITEAGCGSPDSTALFQLLFFNCSCSTALAGSLIPLTLVPHLRITDWFGDVHHIGGEAAAAHPLFRHSTVVVWLCLAFTFHWVSAYACRPAGAPEAWAYEAWAQM